MSSQFNGEAVFLFLVEFEDEYFARDEICAQVGIEWGEFPAAVKVARVLASDAGYEIPTTNSAVGNKYVLTRDPAKVQNGRIQSLRVENGVSRSRRRQSQFIEQHKDRLSAAERIERDIFSDSERMVDQVMEFIDRQSEQLVKLRRERRDEERRAEKTS